MFVKRAVLIVLAVTALAIIAMPRQRSDALPGITYNMGRACYNVVDFGADPQGNTDAVDSTTAWRNAVNTAGANGVGVCAPAGFYNLNGDLTQLSSYLAIIGLGPVTLNETNPNSYIFDSCPTVAVTDMVIPSPCPSAASANTVNVVIDNVTFQYATQAAPPCQTPCPGFTGGLAGWGPSAIYLPSVQSVEINRFGMGNAYHCITIGQPAPSNGNAVRIQNPKGAHFKTACSGHEFAAVGGFGQMEMLYVQNTGGNSTNGNCIFCPVGIDYTEQFGNNTTLQNFTGDYWGGEAYGIFAILDGGTTLSDTNFTDSINDSARMDAFNLITIANYTSNYASTQHWKICDKWDTSWFNGMHLDGGGYAGVNGGVKDISFSCSGLITGGNSTGNGAAQWGIMGSPAPGGFAADGSSVCISLGTSAPGAPGGGATPFTACATAAPGDNAETLLRELQVQGNFNNLTEPMGGATPFTPGPTSAPVRGGPAVLQNPYYGWFGMMFWADMPQGITTPVPYTVWAGGTNLRPIPAFTTTPGALVSCTPPAAIQVGGKNATPVPCYTGYFYNGNAIDEYNAARGVSVHGAYVQSNNGASIFCWDSNSCRNLFVGGSRCGEGPSGGIGAYTCIVFPPVAPPEYEILGDDMEGTNVANLPPFVNQPTAAPFGTSAGNGIQLQSRIAGNAGLYPQTWASSINVPGSTGSKIYNNTPYDCSVYVFANASTITGATASGAPLPMNNGLPPTIDVPTGGYFTLTYTGGTPQYIPVCRD